MAAQAWLGFTVAAEAYYWLQETRFRRAAERGATAMVLYLSLQTYCRLPVGCSGADGPIDKVILEG